MKRELITPKGYDERVCDGCGTGWNEKIVPDTIYGLDIRPACCRHDYAYEVGLTENDKSIADFEFLQNLLILIDNCDKWWYPKWLARRRAITYYDAVLRFGNDAFYAKEENTHA